MKMWYENEGNSVHVCWQCADGKIFRNPSYLEIEEYLNAQLKLIQQDLKEMIVSHHAGAGIGNAPDICHQVELAKKFIRQHENSE